MSYVNLKNTKGVMTKENLFAAMDEMENFFQVVRGLVNGESTFDEAREELSGLQARANELGIGGMPQEFVRQCLSAHTVIRG